jgi:hypothetical protein
MLLCKKKRKFNQISKLPERAHTLHTNGLVILWNVVEHVLVAFVGFDFSLAHPRVCWI